MKKDNKNDELKEIENTLKEENLIDEDDFLEFTDKGDYWEKFLIFNNQIRGYYYYTNKAIIFIGGALGSTKWIIRYSDIKNISKAKIALFMPTGIKLVVFDKEKNKTKKYKMSVLKRDKWLEYIKGKMNR